MTLLSVLADNSFTPDSPLAWFQTGGAVGLLLFLVLGFIRGWVAPSWVTDEKDRRIQELEAEVAETRLFIRDQLMPLLTRTQDVLAKQLEEQAWTERRRRENP